MAAVNVTQIERKFLEVIAVEITRRCVDGIPILDLAGRLVVSTGPTGGALRASIAKLVAEGDVNVLVHLARVTDIDAHGLGQLAGASTMLRRWGGQMALIAPGAWTRRLLSLTRLDTVIAIYDSEVHAVPFAELIRSRQSAPDLASSSVPEYR